REIENILSGLDLEAAFFFILQEGRAGVDCRAVLDRGLGVVVGDVDEYRRADPSLVALGTEGVDQLLDAINDLALLVTLESADAAFDVEPQTPDTRDLDELHHGVGLDFHRLVAGAKAGIGVLIDLGPRANPGDRLVVVDRDAEGAARGHLGATRL